MELSQLQNSKFWQSLSSQEKIGIHKYIFQEDLKGFSFLNQRAQLRLIKQFEEILCKELYNDAKYQTEKSAGQQENVAQKEQMEPKEGQNKFKELIPLDLEFQRNQAQNSENQEFSQQQKKQKTEKVNLQERFLNLGNKQSELTQSTESQVSKLQNQSQNSVQQIVSSQNPPNQRQSKKHKRTSKGQEAISNEQIPLATLKSNSFNLNPQTGDLKLEDINYDVEIENSDFFEISSQETNFKQEELEEYQNQRYSSDVIIPDGTGRSKCIACRTSFQNTYKLQHLRTKKHIERI